ncbi:19078_t:CDS:2 [Funneliformis geosporum]|nr:19078_t:CDS:2 [Funneliformis geosporum]
MIQTYLIIKLTVTLIFDALFPALHFGHVILETKYVQIVWDSLEMLGQRKILSQDVSRGLKTDVLIDIVSTLAIQLHMVKSIVSLAGLYTDDDAVRTLVYLYIVSDEVKSSIAGTAAITFVK